MQTGRNWAAAVAIAGSLLVLAKGAAEARVEAGLLTCEVGGGVALIISSPRELHCVFQKGNGQSEAYEGRLREFGLDIGITGAGVIAWMVVADTTELPPGVLAGNYAGAEVGGAAVVGAEGRALVGGSQRTISLQPLSVEGHVGLNIAVGIAAMELHPLFRATAPARRVRAPAVGHSYATVPHAMQAPHYGCGSYTHLMRGQTLYGLAHACGVTMEALLSANPQITNVRNVSAGALIHLPSHVGHHASSPCDDRVALEENESLEHLAWRCGVTLHALLLANPSVRDVAMLRDGLVLTIPARLPARSAPPVRYAKAEQDVAPRSDGTPRSDRAQRQGGVAPRMADAQGVRSERIRFRSGETGTTIAGRIVGRESVSYVLSAEAGQTMAIALKPSNQATYFNVYAPGRGPGDEALATSDLTGPMTPDLNCFNARLPATGEYTISVYMVRAAARRNERSDYTLEVSISPTGGRVSDEPRRDTGPRQASRDALVPGTQFHATGNIPCARFAGQPMGSCKFGVVREGQGNGSVTVFWPDGGSRVIFFKNGRPANFDQSQADGNVRMTVSRQSDLSMISIGNQRFEIPDAVIFGG